MMETLLIMPVTNIAILAYLFQHHRFRRVSQGQHQQHRILLGQVHELLHSGRHKGTDAATKDALRRRAKQQVLAGDAQIEMGLGERALLHATVEQTEDIGRWSLSRRRSRPVRQVAGPGEQGKEILPLLLIGDDHILQGLGIAGRTAKPGEINQIMQHLRWQRFSFLKAAHGARLTD